MIVEWIGSPNYTPNRAGHNPIWTPSDPNTWIVLHTMVGWMQGTINAFLSSARQASSTYGVGLDGRKVQFVREVDGPWTNGTMQGIGSNLDSITIECEDGGAFDGPRTPELYESVAELVADIAKRRSIPLVHRRIGGGVLAHRECDGASTRCDDSLDNDRIIARAIEIQNGKPYVVTTVPVVAQTVSPAAPVRGVVFDSPTNDRSYLDYATVTYVMGKIADIGLAITWTEAKLVRNPATGATQWLDHIAGTTWALWDDCVDDGGFDPPHFAPAPVVTPPVVVPPVIAPPVIPPVPPVIPPVIPPVVIPPIVPPIITIPDPTPMNLWDAIVAFFRKWFTGK